MDEPFSSHDAIIYSVILSIEMGRSIVHEGYEWTSRMKRAIHGTVVRIV